MSHAWLKVFDDARFDAEVLKSSVPVLVDFTATWCPPCRAMEPHVEAMAQRWAGRCVVGQLDVEQNPLTVERYGVRGMPTFLVFKNGAVVDMLVGAPPPHQLEALLHKHAA